MNLQAMIVLALKISIVLTVLAVGLNATFSDATFLFRRPRKLIRAFLSMNVVMPFLALVLVLSFNLHPAVKIALAALSVSPVPPFFPNNVLQAGGRENYTVGLLVATGVLSIVVIPITMEIFEQVVHTRFAMPAGSIAKVVFVTVLAPLMGAIALRAVAPVFAQKAAKPLGMFATILLTLSCLPVLFGSLRRFLSLIGDGTLLSFAVFALVGYAIGHWLGGPRPEDRRVLGVATASRHPAIAITIAHANFPDQQMAVPAILLYLIVCAIITMLASKRKTGSTPAETKRSMAA